MKKEIKDIYDINIPIKASWKSYLKNRNEDIELAVDSYIYGKLCNKFLKEELSGEYIRVWKNVVELRKSLYRRLSK